MGLAIEVQKVFKVEWLNPDNPLLGFKYLYLVEEDYKRLKNTDSAAVEALDHPLHGR